MSLTKVSYSMVRDAPINIKDYGAVGDGATDDTAAIKLAFAAGAGKSVYIPSGTYLIWKDPADNSVWLPISDDTEIFGDGESSIIKIKPGWVSGASFVYNTPFLLPSRIYLHDFTIDGNRANITAPPELISNIYIINSTDTICNNIKSINANNDCFTIGAAGSPSNFGAVRASITNCIADNPGRSCYVCTNGTEIIISNNFGKNPNNSFIDLETDIANDVIRNVSITGNVCVKDTGYVTMFGCSGPGTQENIVFSGNIITGTNGIGLGNNKNCTITDNVLTVTGVLNNGYVIECISGFINGVISNNTIEILNGIDAGGMWIRDATNVSICGNTILNSKGPSRVINVDVSLSVDPGSAQISDNTIRNCSAVYGIFASSNKRCTVVGNYIEVTTGCTSAIRLTGGNNMIASSNIIIDLASVCIGIDCASDTNVVVSNNSIAGCAEGIDILGANSTITGNSIFGCGTGIGNRGSFNTFSNNKIINSTAAGVIITSGTKTILNGNTILNSVGIGLDVLSGSITISSNIITDNQTPKTQTYAVKSYGAVNNFIISNNDLSGNLTGALLNVNPANYWPTTGAGFGTDVANFNRTV